MFHFFPELNQSITCIVFSDLLSNVKCLYVRRKPDINGAASIQVHVFIRREPIRTRFTVEYVTEQRRIRISIHQRRDAREGLVLGSSILFRKNLGIQPDTGA